MFSENEFVGFDKQAGLPWHKVFGSFDVIMANYSVVCTIVIVSCNFKC